jgi:prefoldin subunit 5
VIAGSPALQAALGLDEREAADSGRCIRTLIAEIAACREEIAQIRETQATTMRTIDTLLEINAIDRERVERAEALKHEQLALTRPIGLPS